MVDPFKNEPLHGEILYFRLHGRGRGYRYEYSEEELGELHRMVRNWGSGKNAAYVMFNNTNMLKDGMKFMEMPRLK